MTLRARVAGVRVTAFLLACCALQPACAGNQKEEALADPIRVALARAIADPRPPQLVFADESQRAQWQRWFDLMSPRLHSRMPDSMVRNEFLQTVWYDGTHPS